MAMEPHAHEHVHDEGHVHAHDTAVDTDVVSPTPTRATYAPVQFASLGIGLFFIAIGAIALARMGFDMTNLRDRSTEVLGIGTTPLLAMIHVGVGVLALICAAGRELARGAMLIIGPIMLAAGAMILARPEFLDDWLATTDTTGVAYLIAGGVGIATVIGTPITWFHRHDRYDRHVPAM